MTITVNGMAIAAETVERELARHARAPEPRRAAIEALVLREVLRQAARAGLAVEPTVAAQSGQVQPGDEGAFIDETLVERLIEREVVKPQLDDEECLAYYENNSEQFRQGDMVEASHILFEAEPGKISTGLREQAEQVLQEALQHPDQFEVLAQTHSACTSASVGGSLGQVSRGETVPEFEQVIFSIAPGTIAPVLVESRFGLHIVRVARRAEGRVLPFDMVREQLAAHLLEQKRKRALRHYLKGLVAQADIQGVEFRLV
jgi:peptidyl-prolyl cis-trans isomerase C